MRELLRTLDAHSEGEWNHAERVSVYSVAIGHRMGLGSADLRTLRFGALLHDVGKVRISAGLLNKTARLDDADFTMLRLHSVLAQEVIGQIHFLSGALPGIRQHHERWDGTGYPDGLRGEAIPIMARIIGAVEAFDLLSWGSFYRKSLSPDAAFRELTVGSENQFDPEVLKHLDLVRTVIQPLGQEA